MKSKTAPQSKRARISKQAKIEPVWQIGNESVRKSPIQCSIDSLRNHAMICGNTSSGKTNTCFNLIEEVWKRKIPFLVIEPAKSEYRQLLMGSQTLRSEAKIYTVGEDMLSPFRINPFEIAKNVHVQTHIDALLAIFNSCFEMYAPMPQVLNRAICSLYQAHGWDLVQNRNIRLPEGVELDDPNCPDEIFPTMKDLYDCIDPVTESFGYSERIGPDVNAALKARIGDLIIGSKGWAFALRSSDALEKLFDTPCILELGDKFNNSEKSFLSSVLMLFLYEHRKRQGYSSRLEHLLLIEDAHRMLKKEGSSSTGDTRIFTPLVSEIFVNLLSESSSYGEGIVISCQSPSVLKTEILSNTNLKIIHRLLTVDDINAIAPAGYLNQKELKEVIGLKTGEAMVLDKGMAAPSKVLISSNKFRADGAAQKHTESVEALRHFLLQQEVPREHASILAARSLSDLNENPQFRAVLELSTMIADDIGFQKVFNRYIMSTVIDLTQLVHFRAQVIHEIQRIIGGRARNLNLVEITWCALVLATERYYEKKGEEQFWRFDIVKVQKQKWLDMMEPAFQPNSVNRRMEISNLQKWRDDFLELQQRELGPYAACGPCKKKCHYRFELSEVVRDPKIRFDFNSSINNPERSASDATAWFCRLLTERLIGKFDADIAYCLAVQFIREQALSSDAQLVLLNKVRVLLEVDMQSAPVNEQSG